MAALQGAVDLLTGQRSVPCHHQCELPRRKKPPNPSYPQTRAPAATPAIRAAEELPSLAPLRWSCMSALATTLVLLLLLLPGGQGGAGEHVALVGARRATACATPDRYEALRALTSRTFAGCDTLSRIVARHISPPQRVLTHLRAWRRPAGSTPPARTPPRTPC